MQSSFKRVGIGFSVLSFCVVLSGSFPVWAQDREASFLPPPELRGQADPVPVAEPEKPAPDLTKPPVSLRPEISQPAMPTERPVPAPSASVAAGPKAEVPPAPAPVPTAVKEAASPVASAPPPTSVAPLPVKEVSSSPSVASPSPAVAVPSAPMPVKEAPPPVAQTQAPVAPPPAPRPEPSIPAVSSVPLPPPPVAVAPEPVKTPAAIAQPVAKESLPAVDPETFGLLSNEQGGLGTALWKDTFRTVIDRLMPAVRLPTPSFTLNDLGRRLFLTTAATSLPAASGEKAERSMVALRIEGLVALGAVSDAWKLASMADPALVDPVTLRQVTEAALIGPDSKSICEKVPALMAAHGKKEEAQIEWQKALLICQLRAGDQKAVQLTLDVMQEQNARRDIFVTLLNRLVVAEKKPLPSGLTPLRPTTLALLRNLDMPLPTELYARPSAELIPELMKTKGQKEQDRLDLAERSAARGVLSKDQLADAYKSFESSPEEVAKILSGEKAASVNRALLYQAVLKEQESAKKVEHVRKFLEGMPPSYQIGAVGQLVADMLEPVPVASDYNNDAAWIAQTFAMAGKMDKAMAWLKVLKEVAPRLPEAAKALQTNWPLFVLAGMVPEADYGKELGAWLDGTLIGGEDGDALHQQREKAGRVLLLLSAAGYAVPEEAWQRVIESAPPIKQMMPSPVLLERLEQAARAGRRGETVLLSLILKGGNVGEASFGVMLEIIKALRSVGLTAEMQSLAREAWLALDEG